MRYALLLRGINVGGKNKVVMADLKKDLAGLGFENTVSYINSGNLFFDSEEQEERIREILMTYFRRSYDFPLPFVLVSSVMLEKETANLPAWWQDETAFRRDVLFYLPETRSSCILGRQLSFIATLTKRTISSPTTIRNCSSPVSTNN